MNAEIEDFVNVYTEYSKIPSPASATLLPNSDGNIIIQSKWSTRDVCRLETVYFVQNYVGKKVTDESLTFAAVGIPVETTLESLCTYSPSRTSFALVRKVLTKKGEEKQYIEIWNSNLKVKTIDLQEIEVHGKIYDDNEFGCMEWSHSEDRLLYIAEEKKMKSKSFFKQKRSKEDCDIPKTDTRMGAEVYSSEEDWGENLVSKHHPVVCIMDITSGDVVVLDSLPDEVSPGQAIWAPDDAGVVCVGWKETPRRLGLVYCTNRRSDLYYIDLETAKCTNFSNKQQHVRSPRFSPDGSTLIYLENNAGGPHHSGSKLMKVDWKTREHYLVVDVKDNAKEKEFVGIYTNCLPLKCWRKDNKHVLFHTMWRSRQVVVCVNIISGKIEVLSEDHKIGYWQVLDVWKDRVMVSCSAPNQLPHIRYTELNNMKEGDSVRWYRVDSMDTNVPDIAWSVINLNPPNDFVNAKYEDLDYEAILVKPVTQTDALPLIVCPHGGPHSAFSLGFHHYNMMFIKFGYAVLQINYRGSVGYGENNLLSLLGNVGTQDIQDVQFAVETILATERINKDELILFGGSHGGFIVAHLIGKYPDFYKLCICRNPVVDISSKLEATDIPDWAWIESGFPNYSFDAIATPDVLKIMWEKSPIRFVNAVKAPTLFLIGRNDRRVPPSQGIKYYNVLKARNVPTRLILYDDSHALLKVEVEADAFVQSMLWIKQHLRNKK